MWEPLLEIGSPSPSLNIIHFPLSSSGSGLFRPPDAASDSSDNSSFLRRSTSVLSNASAILSDWPGVDSQANGGRSPPPELSFYYILWLRNDPLWLSSATYRSLHARCGISFRSSSVTMCRTVLCKYCVSTTLLMLSPDNYNMFRVAALPESALLVIQHSSICLVKN